MTILTKAGIFQPVSHRMGTKRFLDEEHSDRPSARDSANRRSRAGIQDRFGLGTRVCHLMIVSLLAAMLAMPALLNAEPAKGLGMWVWSSSAFSTREAREGLVRFCVQHRIRHLDVHVKISRDTDQPILRDAEALRDLILLAGQSNITTAALRGHSKMFLSKNHERTLRELRAIIAFNETLPGDASFKGVKYDVEPYCTKEWKAEGTTLEAAMRDYLAFLLKARSVLREEAPRLWLAVDTPFWWDKDEFVLDFEGQRKRFNEHVQDLTDFIVVMSYRRSPQEVLACVEGERKYARRIRKVVYPSLETIKLEKDPHISFWGLPNEEIWNVVPQLLKVAEGDPAIGGVMIHCYRGLVEKLNESPPNKPEPATSE